MRSNNEIQCTYALSVEDTCKCEDCVRRREMNAEPEQPQTMAEFIQKQQEAHQDQFDMAVNAGIKCGIGPLFDAMWKEARSHGALPNPWISSMFVFVTGMLLKKFTAGFHPDMPDDHKVQAISDAKQMMVGYLDQMEAAAIKDVYAPKEPQPRCPKCFGPLPCPEHTVTSEGKSKIIMPEKKRFRH